MSRKRLGARTSFRAWAVLLQVLAIGAIVPVWGGAPAGEMGGLTLVLTQVPVGPEDARRAPLADATLPASFGDAARIVVVAPGAEPRVLTEGFHSAADPRLSFDARRILFSGKRRAADAWDIFEMQLDGSGLRRITRDRGNCRNPVYVGPFYTIVSPEPWNTVVFVSDDADERNEHGVERSTSLYSCRLDGSDVQRLTFSPSSEHDPRVLSDGRLLFSVWQRSTLEHGPAGRVSLFTSQIDGLDYALFSGDEGRRVKRMPAVTAERLVVFVEAERLAWDGSGSLGSVSLRRNLHSYRPVPSDIEGLFHSPSALPDGDVLISRRPADGTGSHGIYRLDPRSGRSEPLYDDPHHHDVQAGLLAPRPPPDGRSSVVSAEFSTGVFYGLDVFESRIESWVAPGTPLRLRVLEGLPARTTDPPGAPLLPRRVLGELDVEADGSFNVEVPVGIPIELQLVDTQGLALATCSWIWVRNRETRGCIGCHENGELSPPNRFVDALRRPSVPLTLPPEKRRTVDFRRDVAPLIERRCASAACHGAGGTPPFLNAGDPGPLAPYITPGRARTSPLIWHLSGRNTSRAWDGSAGAGRPAPMPPAGRELLTPEEKQTFMEWIDLGAQAGPLSDPIPQGGRP